MDATVGLGSRSWCKRNQGLSNDFEVHHTQVFVIYARRKWKKRPHSRIIYSLTILNSPFLSDLCNSVGTEELFTY